MRRCIEEMELEPCETTRAPSSFALPRVDRRGGKGIRRGARGGRGGVGGRRSDGMMYGLTGFSAVSRMESAVGGGEAGVASGFGSAVLVQINEFPASGAFHYLDGRQASPANHGWMSILLNTGGVTSFVGGACNGAGTFAYAPSRPLTQSDLGKTFLFVLQHAGNALRTYVDRAEAGTGNAITGYLPGNTRESIGTRSSDSLGAPQSKNVTISSMTWQGVPSTAQIQALYDAVRARGDLPETMDGATVTHRRSARDELRGVQNPAGRKTYGARRFTTGNYQSTPGGIDGIASGFWVASYDRPDEAIAGATGRLHAKENGGNQGWHQIYHTAGVQFRARDNSGVEISSATIPLANIDLYVKNLVVHVHTGTHLRSYCKRVQVGADVPITGFTPSTMPYYFGRDAGAAATGISKFGTAGGLGVPTLAQIQALFDAVEATGEIQGIPGLTSHLYRPTDNAAIGIVDSVGTDHLTLTGSLELAVDVAKAPPCPAQLTDTITRASVDALARVGAPQVVTIDPTIDGRRLLGAQGFSASNFLSTPAGIRGSNTGFNAYWFGTWFGVPATSQTLMACSNNGGDGYQCFITSGGVITLGVRSGGATYTAASAALVTASNALLPHIVHVNYDGVTARLYLDGAEIASIACPAALNFSVSPFIFGTRGDGLVPGNSVAWYGGGGSDAASLTLADVQANAASTLALGRVQAIAGKTQHLWDPTTDILANGVDEVPAVVLDRVGTDHLTRQGTGLTLAQRTERLFSYEKSPIMYCGGSSGAGANRWEGAPSLDTGGSASGFFLGLMLRSKGTANGRVLSHSGGGPQGWNVTGNAGVLIGLNFVDGSGVNRSVPSITVTAGKVACVMATLDGATIKGFHNRAQVGASTTCVGYGTTNLGAVGPTLGSLYGGSSPNADWEIFGWVMGYALPSLAEFAAWEDACMATEDIAALGSGSAHLYSFKRGRSGNRLLDLIGTAHLEPVGAPLVTDVYGRAFAR